MDASRAEIGVDAVAATMFVASALFAVVDATFAVACTIFLGSSLIAILALGEPNAATDRSERRARLRRAAPRAMEVSGPALVAVAGICCLRLAGII